MVYPWLPLENDEALNSISYGQLNSIADLPKGEMMKSEQLFKINMKDDTDRRIVEAIARGMCDKEIATVIFLSTQTVRNRVSRILTSSGLRNRTQLAVAYLSSSHHSEDSVD